MADRIRPLWILMAGGILLSLITVLWVLRDRAIAPPTDSAHHLFNAIYYSRTLSLGGLPALWDALRSGYVGWPPASYTLLYGPLGWALGEQTQMMRLYSLALLPLLLWGTYWLGRELGDRQSGTLASLLTIFSLGISGQLRQVSIDLPATATVLLALVALVRTRGFSRPGASLLLGAACGLCLLSRVQSLFFITGPVLLTAASSLFRAPDRKAKARRLGVMVLALGVAALVSSPWWAGRLDLIWYVITSHLDPGKITPRGDPGFFAGLLYYCGALGKLAGWPILLTALITLPAIIGRRKEAGAGLINILALGLLVLGGVLGAAAGVHREPRYLLPAVPAMALLAVLGARALTRRPFLSAALLVTSVLPTLLLAAFPLPNNSLLERAGILEWAYARRPSPSAAARAALLAKRTLYKAGVDARGRGAYLLFVSDPRVNYLPRLGSFLMPMLPELAFSSTLNPRQANTRWQREQRKRRNVLLISEQDKLLALPLLGNLPQRRFGNTTPIRLYAVPDGHRLRGRIPYSPQPKLKDHAPR